jgi:glycosyltransferase involved in cell wall biosynthesis
MKKPGMSSNQIKIAIDARAMSHPQPGGFKTYTENLVKQFLVTKETFNYRFYLDRKIENHSVLSEFNGSIKIVRAPGTLVGVPIREQFFLPYRLITDHIDLVHFPCATAAMWTPCPFVITIHDTIELMSISNNNTEASLKRKLMRLYNRYDLTIAMRRATAIITVSQNSKKDIVNSFHIRDENIFVTYEAPNEMFLPIEDKRQLDEYRQKNELEGKYILGIGSSDPRKNLSCLIQAYSQLSTDLLDHYQLVIVLTHQRLHETMSSLVKELGLTQHVRFITAVSNMDLVNIYNGASLFVFPSLYEGFGLPLLEAMACGVPVVAANNSSIPEVVGGAGLLVESSNSQEMAQKIARVLTDEALSSDLIQRGFARAAEFSWNKCALETIQVYKHAIKHLTSN